MKYCKYCNADNYIGEKFNFSKNIDGGNQNFEIHLLDSPEDECYVIEINGIYTEIRIDIKYCPFCGRKL